MEMERTVIWDESERSSGSSGSSATVVTVGGDTDGVPVAQESIHSIPDGDAVAAETTRPVPSFENGEPDGASGAGNLKNFKQIVLTIVY